MKKTIAIVLVFILAVLCLASCMPRGGVSSLAGQASSGKLSTGMTVLECLNTLAEDDQLRRTFYPYSLKMNSHPAVYAAELTDIQRAMPFLKERKPETFTA